MVPKKLPKWSPKRTPTVSQNHQNGFQKPSQKRVPKKHQNMLIFSTPECGQSIVNRSKFDHCQVLVFAPFGVSFWRSFGSLNGGQCHQKATSKNIKKMMPKMTPNWSQRGSQNEAKIVKNDVLEAHCFKGGSQVASRAPPGSILERFWDHFGTTFNSFLNRLFVIWASVLEQHVANTYLQNHKESRKKYNE